VSPVDLCDLLESLIVRIVELFLFVFRVHFEAEMNGFFVRGLEEFVWFWDVGRLERWT